MKLWQSLLVLAGRIAISALFLWAALAKIFGIEGTMQYMASKNMPFIPFFLAAALFLQIGGAALVLLGYRARLGACMLILFIVPAAIIFHDFWNLTGVERLTEQIMFMKDVGTLGGLLILAAYGPGSISIDKRSS